jgi:hypothetical protein
LTATQLANKLLADAVEKAKKADAVVIMAGLTAEYESEGYDRTHLQLPRSHNRLISEIAKVNDNVAVVLYNGAPVLMLWLAEVAAVVEAYLPGEAGGSAVWDVLLGEENPQGGCRKASPLPGKTMPQRAISQWDRKGWNIGKAFMWATGIMTQPVLNRCFPLATAFLILLLLIPDLRLTKTK